MRTYENKDELKKEINKSFAKQISDRDTLKNTIKFAQTSCC